MRSIADEKQDDDEKGQNANEAELVNFLCRDLTMRMSKVPMTRSRILMRKRRMSMRRRNRMPMVRSGMMMGKRSAMMRSRKPLMVRSRILRRSKASMRRRGGKLIMRR